MKLLIIILLLCGSVSFAEKFTEEDRKYLADLPEPTSENFRWLVPADAWRYKKAHLMKGKYFKINSIKNLKIYKTKKFEGTPEFSLRGGIIYKGHDNYDGCGKTTYERDERKISDVLQCNHGSCEPLDLTGEFRKDVKYNYSKNELLDSTYLLNAEKYKICHVDIDYVAKTYINDKFTEDNIYSYVTISKQVHYKKNHYLKIIAIDKNKNYLEILVNGKKHYVDIRECKKHPENCKKVDIKFSDYEKDWIRLKKHQEKKDLYGMNYLLKNLKPCVEKKDEACIKKFFPDPVKDDYLPDSYVGYKIPNIEVNDELIKELKACLDYKNLLPHLYASRGIEKACIFNFQDSIGEMDKSDMKLLNVTYPEAVRIARGSTIYVIPKEK